LLGIPGFGLSIKLQWIAVLGIDMKPQGQANMSTLEAGAELNCRVTPRSPISLRFWENFCYTNAAKFFDKSLDLFYRIVFVGSFCLFFCCSNCWTCINSCHERYFNGI